MPAPIYRFIEHRGFRGRTVAVYAADINGVRVERLGGMGYVVGGKFAKTLAAAMEAAGAR